jgi:hypothetical protein
MTKLIRYLAPNGRPIYLNPDYLVCFQYMGGGMSKLYLSAGPEPCVLVSDSEAASIAYQLQELGLLECE